MREIKFRAWCREGEWDEGGEKRNFIMIDACSLCVQELQPLAYSLKDIEDECYFMQYTGLKDSEGVEIYEGDSIQFAYDDKCEEGGKGYCQGVVTWYNGCFVVMQAVMHNEDPFTLHSWLTENPCNVIGNIHQNNQTP